QIVGTELESRLHQDRTYAGLRGKHFSGDDHAPGAAERDPHAGDDVWNRGRQNDPTEQRQARRTKAAAGIHENGIDAARTGFSVEIKRKELGDEHDENDGGVTQPEPEDRERNPGDSRDG